MGRTVLLSLFATAASILPAHGSPTALTLPRTLYHPPCPPLPHPGDIIFSSFELYPENADWDPLTCRVWLGALFNATAVVYNPYANAVESVLSFPGISHTGTLHIGGVAWDPYNSAAAAGGPGGERDIISILASSARPFATSPPGEDVSGERGLIKWDATRGEVLWTVNVTDASHGRYGGFQDVEHDAWGRTYIVGTWPGTILRVERDGTGLVPWLVPEPLPPTTKRGYTGLATVAETGGKRMLTVDGDGRLYRFELREDQGRGEPVGVPIVPEVLYDDTDAIYLPPVFGGKVLLVSSHAAGIQVLRSRDWAWEEAEYLGTIPLPTGPLYEGGGAVAAVQMGSSSVFMVIEFVDQPLPGLVAGNRTLFPFSDITDQIEALLRK